MPTDWDWSRREFLRSMLVAMGAGVVGGGARLDALGLPPMPKRTLGKTGLQVSLLGLGGGVVGQMKDAKAARGVVHRLMDLGVNYLDTAPTYSSGVSEQRIGEAIRGRRDEVILATKSFQPRTRAHALNDLEQSLKRLGTDYVDVWQIHSLRDHGDIDRVFADDGPVRVGEEARKAGKIRHLGVTGHVNPEVNLRALEEYEWATMLLPLNLADPHHLSFVKGTLPKLVEQNVGVVAMKVLAAGRLTNRSGISATDCLRYAFSLPIATAIVGLGSLDHVATAVDAALQPPLEEEAMEALVARVQDHPGKSLEWYKGEVAPRKKGGSKGD